jgi:hypothetical protein
MTSQPDNAKRWQISLARMMWVVTLFCISIGVWFNISFGDWFNFPDWFWLLRPAISGMAGCAAVGLLSYERTGGWAGAVFGFAVGVIGGAAFGFVRAIDIFTSM